MGDKEEPTTPAPSPTEEGLADFAAGVGAPNGGNGGGSTSGSDNPTPTHVKVVIIGAGMAGLSAANHLLQNGCEDFLILEARGRIGGRIVSIPLSNNQKVALYNPSHPAGAPYNTMKHGSLKVQCLEPTGGML